MLKFNILNINFPHSFTFKFWYSSTFQSQNKNHLKILKILNSKLSWKHMSNNVNNDSERLLVFIESLQNT